MAIQLSFIMSSVYALNQMACIESKNILGVHAVARVAERATRTTLRNFIVAWEEAVELREIGVEREDG